MQKTYPNHRKQPKQTAQRKIEFQASARGSPSVTSERGGDVTSRKALWDQSFWSRKQHGE